MREQEEVECNLEEDWQSLAVEISPTIANYRDILIKYVNGVTLSFRVEQSALIASHNDMQKRGDSRFLLSTPITHISVEGPPLLATELLLNMLIGSMPSTLGEDISKVVQQTQLSGQEN
jgi:hypothetical protein